MGLISKAAPSGVTIQSGTAVFSAGSYLWSLITTFTFNVINKDCVCHASSYLLAGLQHLLVREGEGDSGQLFVFPCLRNTGCDPELTAS